MKCRFYKVLTIYVFAILYFSDSIGCLYNVRDIGFSDISIEPYHLYLYIDDNTSDVLVSNFKQISSATLIDYNIVVEIVNIKQDVENPALEYYNFWNISDLPAVLLQAPTGRSMVVPISETDFSSKETLWPKLESIAYSPVRDEIMENIIRAYCVILLIEGRDAKGTQKVNNEILNVRKEISKTMDQLPKRIEVPPHIITLAQDAIPDEKVLLWSLDIDEKIDKEPVVVCLFGRGRRFGPILTGQGISQSKLLNILSIIGLSCECGLDLSLSMDPPVLLRWGEQEQRQVLQYLGIDVENPMVKLEMSNILSLNRSSQAKDIIRDFDDVLEGYREEIIKSSQRSSATRVSPSQMQDLDARASPSIFNYTIYMMGFLALLAFAGGGYILSRARRKNHNS